MQRLRALLIIKMLNFSIITIFTHFLAFVLGAISILMLKKYLKRSSQKTKNKAKEKVIGAQPKHKDKPNKEIVHTPPTSPSIEKKESSETTSEPETQEKKLSKKELRDLQKKEDRARRKQAAQERKEAEALEKKKKAFNPLISKPENAIYFNLAVSDGKLVPCSIGQTYYYHYWEYEGTFYYEFFCEQSKVAKAVNNRSVIIDPFCQKDSESVAVDEAKSMVIKQFGVIDQNFNVLSKSLISYK